MLPELVPGAEGVSAPWFPTPGAPAGAAPDGEAKEGTFADLLAAATADAASWMPSVSLGPKASDADGEATSLDGDRAAAAEEPRDDGRAAASLLPMIVAVPIDIAVAINTVPAGVRETDVPATATDEEAASAPAPDGVARFERADAGRRTSAQVTEVPVPDAGAPASESPAQPWTGPAHSWRHATARLATAQPPTQSATPQPATPQPATPQAVLPQEVPQSPVAGGALQAAAPAIPPPVVPQDLTSAHMAAQSVQQGSVAAGGLQTSAHPVPDAPTSAPRVDAPAAAVPLPDATAVVADAPPPNARSHAGVRDDETRQASTSALREIAAAAGRISAPDRPPQDGGESASRDSRQPFAGTPSATPSASHASSMAATSAAGLAVAPADTLARPTVEASAPDAPITPRQTAENVARLVESVRVQWRQGVPEATVKLHPEHLGEVTISVRVERGQVAAVVHAETAAVQQWLESQEEKVRSGLADQGLTLERFVVQRDRQQQQQRRDGRQSPQARYGTPAPSGQRFEITV